MAKAAPRRTRARADAPEGRPVAPIGDGSIIRNDAGQPIPFSWPNDSPAARLDDNINISTVIYLRLLGPVRKFPVHKGVQHMSQKRNVPSQPARRIVVGLKPAKEAQQPPKASVEPAPDIPGSHTSPVASDDSRLANQAQSTTADLQAFLNAYKLLLQSALIQVKCLEDLGPIDRHMARYLDVVRMNDRLM